MKFSVVQLISCLLAFCLAAPLPGQPTFTGKVSGGFQAPTSTDSDGRRHVIRGKDMESRSNGVLELTEPRVTRYNPDDTTDMFIESAHCIYETKAGVAYSRTNLLVRTTDSRFSLQGVGWHWDLSGSLLTISNQVVAQVQKAALSGETNRLGRATNQAVQIMSRLFQQEGNAATFSGGVLVKDGEDTLRCERLKIHFVKPGGAQRIEAHENVSLVQRDTRIESGKAVYDVMENIIRISEKPKWSSEQREGSAEELVVNRNTDTLVADGKVYMKLPVTNLVLNAAGERTNSPAPLRFVEIRSDRFEFFSARSNRTAEAVYTGHVQAIQVDAALACQRLTANFGAGNRLSGLKASEGVEIKSANNSVWGREADYDMDGEKMIVTGEPRWKINDVTGRSDNLVFYTKTREILALLNVEMIVPGRSFGGVFAIPGGTNVSATNSPLKITAQSLSYSERLSVFQRDVVVADARGTIQCALLTLFAGASNQVQRIVAEKDVVVKQPDMVALGDRAEYDQATGQVRLTGDPELLAPGKSLRAETFIIDRNRNTFSVSPGKYRIELQLSQKPETK